jgi:murein DD-endopeptidase MepM/ murein hydrolase activator NlpD
VWKRPLTPHPNKSNIEQSSSFPCHRFPGGAEPKNILTINKKLFAKIGKKTKGFLKDPFFYFGSVSVILLILVSFVVSAAKENNQDFSVNFAQEQIAAGEIAKKTFVEPTNSQVESPDFCLIQGNSMLGFNLPVIVTPQVLGVILGEPEVETTINKEIVEYEVQSGDSLGAISEKFGITLSSLLWANNLSKSSAIKLGQKLVVPPVSGVIHYVKSGDTISAIALKYKADAEKIISFNELASQDDVFVGDILIVPDGTMPQVASKPVYVQQDYIPVASSYFIAPISSPYVITQRLHWYNAIDFNHGKNSCGDYIYAAAGGTVQKVKYGYNGGAGNTITILHPNGVVTGYGHILTSLVNPGDQVSQGQVIATMGGQPGTAGAGKSTGCHVHFSVHGAANPFK